MSTLANFRTAIAAELGLSTTAAGADEVEVDRRVNEGVVDVLLRTGCKVTSATMTETAGTGDYTLDTAILTVKALQWSGVGGSYNQPERVSPEEIERLRSFSTASSSPASFYAVAGSNLLMVYPTPSTADTITIYYVPRPATLATGTDTPSEIPAEFHPAVEQYALWKLASMTDDSTSGQGERYRIVYEGQDGRGGLVARVRKHVHLKGGRSGRARLHPSRRGAVRARNDQY